jgi:hypothetical protein
VLPAPTAAVDDDLPGVRPMALLERGIPLSLLLDLAFGPCSEELLAHERASLPAPRAERSDPAKPEMSGLP